MKKMYIICFLVLCVAFSAVFFGSYQLTQNRLQEEETGTAVSDTQIVGVAKAEESIITRKTAYVLEEYCINDESLVSEETEPPIEVLGYDRARMLEYIQNYMDNMSETDKDKGLISYELTEFSKDKVVVRKTYYQGESTAQFYLDVQMGRIVVYQTADDSLYAYTEVKFNNLPENLRREILSGKYIETVEELYHFLESYSS